MPRYKQPENHIPMSVETSYREQGEIGAIKASIIKYCKIIDMTDSARDIRPLVTGLFEAIDRLKNLEASSNMSNNTALFRILDKAEKNGRTIQKENTV